MIEVHYISVSEDDFTVNLAKVSLRMKDDTSHRLIVINVFHCFIIETIRELF